MSLSRICVERPVASCLMAVAILMLGLLAYFKLPVAALPQTDIPVIIVRANLPGASPESMAATVATPLERAMTGVSGVQSIDSSSNQGATELSLDFDLDTDINTAAREVQAAINTAIPQLPAGMPSPPSYRKINPSQRPILQLALSSEHIAASDLYEIATTRIMPHLAQVPGVGEVTIDGAALPAVRVNLNPNALISQGVSLEQVRQAISDYNQVKPVGIIEQGQLRWQIQLAAAELDAAQFANIVIQQQADRMVRLKDVAEVSASVENRYVRGFHNQQGAVLIRVRRQPAANTVATIAQIKAKLPFLQALIPSDSQLRVVIDNAAGIHHSLDEAWQSLLFSICLVVVVTCLLMGRLRSALIPSLAVLVSLIGAFALMYLAGFSLNNLSIMALIVAIGLVIDDAIVVLENIERHLGRGLSPYQAAIVGAKEVGTTLLAMNVVLCVIFVAILWMGGVIERLFREFSLSLVFIMALSLLMALTLVPSLSARIFRPQSAQTSLLYRLSQQLMDGLRAYYRSSLRYVLKRGYWLIVLWLGCIAASAYLYHTLPQIMLPQQDTGRLGVFIRGDDGFSYQVMQPKIQTYVDYLLTDPAVDNVVGSAGNVGTTNAELTVNLKPKAERGGLSSQQVAARLKRHAPFVAGAVFGVEVHQDINLDNPFSSDQAQGHTLLLQSDNVPELRKWTKILAQAMQKLPQLDEVDTIGDEGAQQLRLNIDRQRAKMLGVEMSDVANVLNNSFSQRQVSTIFADRNQFHVVMEVDKRLTETPESLQQLQISNHQSQAVPLTNFATWAYSISNDRISHLNQYAVTGIGYEIKAGYSEAEAEQAIRGLLPQLMLPNDMFVLNDHDLRAASLQTGLSVPWIVLCVAVLMYLVLGISYENLIHPLSILSTIPAVSLGALLILWLTDLPFSLIAMLGMFLLIGMVVKNAILLVDFAIHLHRTGLSAEQAIFKAAVLRFRPIMMTNLAALFGAIPLAMGLGEGSEMRQPLGVAIVGGLALGQFLTLYTTPVIYLYLERFSALIKARRAKAAPLDG
jgi:multidrug efflux pump